MFNRLAYVIPIVLVAACSSKPATTDAPPGAADAPLTTADGPPAAAPPNIVFILTDDLNNEVYSHMTRLQAVMDAQGTTFRRHFLNISLCCPSRTAILRGQYAHNTRIFGNNPPEGGFEAFYANGSEADTLPVWMAAAGYRTTLIGKYLNGYPDHAGDDYVPPGWTHWASPIAGQPYEEYGYTLNIDGTGQEPHLDAPEDYLVDVIADKTEAFIRQAAADHVPFYAHLTPYAPHAPATPPDRYQGDFAGEVAPRTASFNEADVSDKPAWLAAKPLLDDGQIATMDMLYRKRLRSMEAVEDLVQRVVDVLTETGQLDNTYIVFTSDNGFHQGQHRLDSGKNSEFDEDLIVPLIIRGPGVPAGAVVDLDTINVDFAPTFLDLAGAPIPAGVDGRSLVPLLAGTTPPDWRNLVFLEHAEDVDGGELQKRGSVDPGTLEPLDPEEDHELLAGGGGAEPAFEGVRTDRYTYVELATGENELFDDVIDPDQLTNIIATASPGLLAQLHDLIAGMHACQGAACRTAEQTVIHPGS